jgi:hypothetical protein
LHTLWTELTIMTKISKDINIFLTILPPSLSLRNDHLNGWNIVGVGNRVLHKANATYDLSNTLHLSAQTTLHSISRIANKHLAINLIQTH